MKIAVASLGNFHAKPFGPELQVKQMLATRLRRPRNKEMSPYRMSKIEESVRTALQFFDGINSKNITQLNDIIDDKCIFGDLWENTPEYNDKNKILEYFTQQFISPNNIKINVSEANNFDISVL